MGTKNVILIVDQEKILVDLLSQKLSGDTIDVVSSQSAEYAQALVTELHPNVVIVDPTIPNGMHFLEELVAADAVVAVIALTHSDAVRDRLAAMCVECVDKSQGLERLLEAVTAYIDADAAQETGEENDDEMVEVLVVDDDDELLDMMSVLLKGWGYTPVVARTGAEAIRIIETDPRIAAVMLDVRLPDIGGLDTLKVIQGLNPGAGVVMISGLSDREIAQHAMKLGAFDYITKPMDFSALESTLIACLSHTEYQRQSWWKRLIS